MGSDQRSKLADAFDQALDIDRAERVEERQEEDAELERRATGLERALRPDRAPEHDEPDDAPAERLD